MRLEDGEASLFIRVRDMDFAVEAAGTEQSFIEILGTVGCRNHDDALGAFEAIHGGEQRIDGLLMFGVRVEFAVLADAIDFIDEDDSRLVPRGLAEKLAHTFSAHADEDLGKIAAMGAEE